MLSRWRMVMKSSRPYIRRSGMASVSTIAKPAKMAPATKYGGKIVACQPGTIADGEVEADDRVHRHHQRRREPRQQQVRRLVAMPVPGRAAPAHGEACRRRSVPPGCGERSRSVARSGISPTYQKSSDTVT